MELAKIPFFRDFQAALILLLLQVLGPRWVAQKNRQVLLRNFKKAKLFSRGKLTRFVLVYFQYDQRCHNSRFCAEHY